MCAQPRPRSKPTNEQVSQREARVARRRYREGRARIDAIKEVQSFLSTHGQVAAAEELDVLWEEQFWGNAEAFNRGYLGEKLERESLQEK